MIYGLLIGGGGGGGYGIYGLGMLSILTECISHAQ